MTSPLSKQECIPCRGGEEPLKGNDLTNLQAELGGGWDVVDEHHLEKVFKFKDWQGAVDFVNAISPIAESQNHHPDLEVGWGKVKVVIFTHKIGGLTQSDFVLAAKFDIAAAQLKQEMS